MATATLTDVLAETLDVFESSGDPGEPLTTQEVTDELEVSRRSVYDRLERLVECERLRTKKAGARGRIWWQPNSVTGVRSGTATQGAGAGSTLDTVLEDLPGMVYRSRTGAGWHMSFVSDGCAAITGYDREAIESGGVSWEEDVIHPGDRERVRDEVAEGLEASGEFVLEYRVLREDGETRWVWERGCAVADEAREGDQMEGIIMDVTDRRGSGRALSQRDEQFRALVDASEEYAIFMLDTEGQVITWNSGAERIKGYEKTEILGEHFSTFYTEADREAGVPTGNLEAAREDGKVEDQGWRVRADGSTFWANVTISAIRGDDGELRGFAKVTRDMTERHRYEERLREERDFTRQILEAAPASIFVVDDEGAVLRANDQLWNELGADEDSGLAVGDLTVRDESGAVVPPEERPYRTVFETGEAVEDWRCQVETPTGERRWVSLNVAPITAADGETVENVVVAAQDVTQLKEQAGRLERQRDDLESELESVFERIDDAFFALDDDWRFDYVNDQAADLLGRDAGELLGASVWEVFPEAVGTVFRDEYEKSVATQESTTFTAFFPPLATWFEVNAYPSGDGLSVYFRDVTEREARKRELERYETVVETMKDGVYVVDGDGTFTMVNEPYAEMVGADREEVLGSDTSRFVDEETRERVQTLLAEMESGERDAARIEADFHPAEDSRLRVEATVALVDDDDPVERVGVVRDVTQRKAREEELELYETIVDTIDDGVYVLDSDQRFVKVNDAYLELTGYERDELLGEHASLVVDQDVADEAASVTRQLAGGETAEGVLEADVKRKDGTTVRAESRFTPLPSDDVENPRKIGVVRDVSDRVERERELERRVHQQEAIADLGQQALEERDLDDLMARAAERVSETLGTDYCKVLDLDRDGEELLLRQGVGWHDGIVGEASISAVEADSQAAYTLDVDGPVVVEDLTTESRFTGPDLLRDHDVRSGISTVIGPEDEPWGILGTHDRESRQFSTTDVTFLQSVANILATAIERHEYEAELLRQREQLAALNNLNGVVREVTEAAIDQSTREEIEQVACEALANSGSYMFAWTGEVDVTSETVEFTAEANTGDYLDDLTISVDPDDPHSEGATGRAFRTGEVQTTQHVDEDERYEPWADAVEAQGFQSSAAIPLTHEDTVFGVLNVYAERPDAFTGEEYDVITQLGEVLGHAIAAVERKRALMSDEVVELEFHIGDIFEDLGIDGQAQGHVSLAETIPIRDDEYLVYGTVREDGVETLEVLVDSVPHWQSVTISGADTGDRRFELRLSDPPVLSTVASLGGTVERALIEDGDYRMTIHLSPSTDVRTVIDAVQGAYPSAEMRKRHQVTKDRDTAARVEGVLDEGLTDRQRTALRAAYHADFFEWPRETTGEDLAESLGVSPPTFHQHLRKAEKKVFDSLLSEGESVSS